MNHSMSNKCGEINQSIIIQEINQSIIIHLHKPLSLSELLLYRVCPYLYNIFYFKVHNLIMLLSFFTLKLDQTIITLFPFFIEMLQYDWLWNGHMIIKERFYIPVKLKPELARTSMTTSDVNNQWHSNFQQQIIHSLSRVVVPATLHTQKRSKSFLRDIDLKWVIYFHLYWYLHFFTVSKFYKNLVKWALTDLTEVYGA
jgi:hypothetical protein